MHYFRLCECRFSNNVIVILTFKASKLLFTTQVYYIHIKLSLYPCPISCADLYWQIGKEYGSPSMMHFLYYLHYPLFQFYCKLFI